MPHSKKINTIRTAQAVLANAQRGKHGGRKLPRESTRMACPHCGAEMQIRASRAVSKTMRELAYQCTNVDCGFCAAATTELQRVTTPSARPDPSVRLPLSQHVHRALARSVLDTAGTAAHEPFAPAPPCADELFEGLPPPAS